MKPWYYEIEGEGDEALRHALNYVASAEWGGLSKFFVTHCYVCNIQKGKYGYTKDDEGYETLFLGGKMYDAKNGENVTELAFTHDIEAVYDFARRWLKQAHYGPQPDTDGSNNPGWRLFEPPTIAGCGCDAKIAIQGHWITYGK